MNKKDPYFRNFISNTNPERTPFSRSGTKDKGHYFIYLTNSKKWSLLLDSEKYETIQEEVQQQIPMGYNQLWLLKKIFSTKRLPKKPLIDQKVADHTFNNRYPIDFERKDWPHRLYVVLREPYNFLTVGGDILTYSLDERNAVKEASIYTQQKNRRAVVGLLIWDLQWH